MYVDIQYTRLFSSSLRSSHTLTSLLLPKMSSSCLKKYFAPSLSTLTVPYSKTFLKPSSSDSKSMGLSRSTSAVI